MITAIPQKSVGGAKRYFDEHLSHNDYYCRNEVRPGEWIGNGVDRLGLQVGSVVCRDDFLALCDNRHPATQETLTQRRNQDGNRRLYYDFTCSAPKSVSVMGVTMQDERIVQAHQNASRIAILELQQFAAARIRTQGQRGDRLTGNLVGAQFLHNSSRALDPQLHTHFVVFNCTFDEQEKRWKALETGRMFGAIQYATEVYRNELAKELVQLGYEIENQANGFEIKGVSESVVKMFSKRAAEREKMVASLEEKLGRKLSNDEISRVIHQTRAEKLAGISQHDVRQLQLSQMSETEQQSLRSLIRNATGPVANSGGAEEQALKFAQEHLFERESVVPEHKLLHAALVQGRGRVNLHALKATAGASSEFIRVGQDITTREVLKSEWRVLGLVDEGKGSCGPIDVRYQPADPELGQDQKKAVSFLLKSSDQITGIRGLAGTGKSRTLKELFRALDRAQYRPVLCAPTGSATENLRKDGLSATTLQRLFVDEKLQSELSPKSVIVVDEAGMVGLNEMEKLFDIGKKQGARVILCGDTRQHSSVTRGDALRLLETHSGYSFAELSVIRRQQNSPAYLEAVRKAAAGQTQQAFDLLERMGAISESTRIYEDAAKAYQQSMGAGKATLLVAPTWNEISALTDRVRSDLKQRGIIGSTEQLVPVEESLSWTKAQRKSLRSYVAGQTIVFHQKNGSFSAGETATVLRKEGNALFVQRADGSEQRFRPCRPESFDVCQTKQLRIAAGDQLLLQAPHRGEQASFVNGEIVRVKEIDGSSIKLADGRCLPAGYRSYTHGYAVTSHTAQSKTVDRILVVASSASLPAIHARQFYVDVSRGREQCRVFTDDKALLRERVGLSRDRTSAIELTGLSPGSANAAGDSESQVSATLEKPRISRFRLLPRLFNARISVQQRGREIAHEFAL